MTVVRMPEVATGTGSAAVQTWLVKVGDEVRTGQPIVEIETEKAVVEYEAEIDGVFAAALLGEGDAGDVGVPIAVIATGGQSIEDAMKDPLIGSASAAQAEAAPAEPAPAAPAPAAPAAAPSAPAPAPAPAPAAAAAPAEPAAAPAAQAPADGRRIFASPLVRRLAGERGVDLSTLTGSGPHGRIVRRDLDALPEGGQAAAAPAAAPAASAPAAAPAPAARVEESGAYTDTPHTGMRRAIARRLTESKSTVPHFYLAADCKVDALLALRAQINAVEGVKVSVNDFVVKAAAWALRDVPEANAIWMEDAIRQFEHVDISIAVAIPGGLITPVLRGADRMSLSELSSSVRELAERARDGKLKQSEIEGGSFSVSNLGMYGTREFSAIINPPHAGILAVGAATDQAVVEEGEIRVAKVMRVTLSADHRVVDGALAATWLAAFVRRIENPLSIVV